MPRLHMVSTPAIPPPTNNLFNMASNLLSFMTCGRFLPLDRISLARQHESTMN